MNRREALTAILALPAVERVSVASLKPKDVIVLECNTHLKHETAERFRACLEDMWPGHKVLVLDAGLKIKVVEG